VLLIETDDGDKYLMTTTDKRKRSLYFPDNILREMQSEAKRQERSLSWIVQYAWRIARSELMRLPSVGNSGFRDDDDHSIGHDDDVDHAHPHEHDSHHGHDGFSDSSFPHHGS
jgi:uncharacterized small protein (TIGR04563 family)